MKNLLSLTFRYYAALAALLWLLSVPVSYFIIQRLVIQDVDDALLARKTEIGLLLTNDHHQLLEYLPRADPDVQLKLITRQPGFKQPISDRLYDTTYYLPLLDEWEPHRELKTGLSVNGQLYQLRLRQSLVEREDFIVTITGLQTGVFLLLLLGLGLINRQMTRRLWQPFTDVLGIIRRFRLEKDPLPDWPATQVLEFNELQGDLTTLIRRNQVVYASQKQFTENASHELQTPLAVISAELEVLFQSEGLPDEELAHVQRATEAVQRLAQLNKALTLLTQIENRQFIEDKSVHIGQLIDRLLKTNAEFIRHKQLRLTYTQSADPAVLMNPQLAEVLLGNLVRNAIRHTPTGGDITIHLLAHQLRVSNSGESLPFPEEAIFERFVKNPALPEATGLGLAIAHQIADRYGLSLTYTYESDQHHFIVSWRIN
ncbi:sensor histidine kinase [Spirosoma sp. HMF4905]|uniref:histidine kinase n=1 Tax=Spirosoma arboris TaxID=2682092 RepID=A0A7K1SIP2_9BACT|nr:HAMP domain-containing sensor histidine kinase [Spirosoma arboris]MVM33691.1 sensor histidine kinase [Spirosoma arboris]